MKGLTLLPPCSLRPSLCTVHGVGEATELLRNTIFSSASSPLPLIGSMVVRPGAWGASKHTPFPRLLASPLWGRMQGNMCAGGRWAPALLYLPTSPPSTWPPLGPVLKEKGQVSVSHRYQLPKQQTSLAYMSTVLPMVCEPLGIQLYCRQSRHNNLLSSPNIIYRHCCHTSC